MFPLVLKGRKISAIGANLYITKQHCPSSAIS